MEGTASDITDGKLLRAQLDQALKMQAIGTLAGGIAHDFNNILAPIIGYTELSLNMVSQDPRLSHNMRQVLLSANRAKDLVRQILTFSRKTERGNKPVQVSLIIKEALKLLRSSLPSTIDIRQSVHPDAVQSTTMADPTQIHQVLMNLCTNAGHAMRAKGGTLSITLDNVENGPGVGRETPDMGPGPYLKLSVADTGHGMDEAVRQRIFDPYFTTKGPDEGTGLGLAVVYGIVKNLSGAIAVSSKPGEGAVFDVYLPRAQTIRAPSTGLPALLPTGHGRVLVVDDEKSIVDMIMDMLDTLGYEAVPRYSSPDALEAFRARPESFDLVITDMTMPHLTGIDLARQILMIRPHIPIILCTGFSEALDENKIKRLGIKKLLMKPVSMRDLAVTVNKILVEDKLIA
jgi:nitrogen-specific signal transduction histidine kinase/ActR/RegA family two-component response regulator